jgi:hypothetical protein
MRPLQALLFALLPAAALVAQTPPNLFGITLAPLSGTPMLHQSQHSTCTPLGSCTTALPATTLNYWPGGSAYDSSTGTAWATTGTLLSRHNLTTCGVVGCGPVPCPRSAGSQATGLDVHDALGELWTIDSNGIITRSTNNCSLTFITSHATVPTLALQPGPVATSGITIDELRGLVFYSTCNFAVGSGNIHVALMGSPGAWFQATPVIDCFTNPSLITGLAVDAGNSVLYWTNGRGTMSQTYTYNPAGPSVTFGPPTCCIQVAPFTEPYTDLSIKWGGATSSGTPCANGTCPSCPMVHVLRNAPLLGTTLQLGLDLAPTSMPAWCLISFGSCGTGTTFGPLCGPLLINLGASAITLGMNVTSAGVGCTGTTTFLLPLPSNPAFAGLPLASQCVGLCPPTGTTMSNCLSWVLQ